MHDNLHIKPQHEGDENGRLKKKREFSHFFLVLFAILAIVYVIRCAGKVCLDIRSSSLWPARTAPI